MTEYLSGSVSKKNAIKFGFPVSCLILGVLSIAFSIFLVGFFLALIAIALGVIHLRKSTDLRSMTIWGISLSVVGLLATFCIGYLYYMLFIDVQEKIESIRNEEEPIEGWQGVPSPDITLQTLNGETIHLSELKGKRVILDFWATWCPPCVKEIPHFIQLYGETSREDLIIIGISNEAREKLEKFVEKKGINYPIASGKLPPPPYDTITSIPTTFFIDRKGIIQNIIVGYHDYNSLKEYALADDYQSEPKLTPVSQFSESEESVSIQ